MITENLDWGQVSHWNQTAFLDISNLEAVPAEAVEAGNEPGVARTDSLVLVDCFAKYRMYCYIDDHSFSSRSDLLRL